VGCLTLTIVGGVSEVCGLGLVAWEVTRLQRQEFGPPVWIAKTQAAVERGMRRLRARVRRLLRKAPQPIEAVPANLSGTSSASGSASGTLTVKQGPARFEDRVRALEAALDSVREDAQRARNDFEARAVGIENRVREVDTRLEEHQTALEAARRAAARRQIRTQTLGAVLVFIGAVLSVLGNAATC
jgi:flagellar hook-basal body complex protein FliE